MMKAILSLVALLATVVTTSTLPVFAEDVWVNGYTRSNGTYVQGYYRSRPDGNPYNNYSSQGNTNPYTGQKGTVNPYSNYDRNVGLPATNLQYPNSGYRY